MNPLAQTDRYHGVRKSEMDCAGSLQWPWFSWVSPMLSRGNALAAQDEMMGDDDQLILPECERSAECADQLRAAWQLELNEHPDAPSLIRALRKTFGRKLVISALFQTMVMGSQLASPFLLRELVKYYTAFAFTDFGHHNKWEGFVWVVALSLNHLVGSLSNHAALHFATSAFSSMRNALVCLIYEKTLRTEANHGISGRLQALHGTDAIKFNEMGLYFHGVWTAFPLIAGALVALYFFIGWAGVTSIGIILILFPLQAIAGKRMQQYRSGTSKLSDKRIQIVNEALQGIRIVKFMNWEDNCKLQVGKQREIEMTTFRRLFTARSAIIVSFNAIPAIVQFAVFSFAYVMGREITTETVFPTIAMLNNLRTPLAFLPLSGARFIDLKVSIDRIALFLLRPERKPYATPLVSGNIAVELRNVNILTNAEALGTNDTTTSVNSKINDAPAMRVLMADVSVKFPKGKLTIVVGPTGSGKSTLITALIGEASVSEGSFVGVSGTIAYVPQEPWCMNATVRDNITMGSAFDELKYQEAVNDCQLIADLEQFPASDMTEIGERGINVSGGQKQRMAFARAVYSDRDTVVMDDPLSAVDPHVCVSLFDNCIQTALDGRTRILVTHQVQFLPDADHIVVVVGLRVVFQGTYDEFLARGFDVSMLEDRAEKSLTSPAPETPTAQSPRRRRPAAATNSTSLCLEPTMAPTLPKGIPKAPSNTGALMSSERSSSGVSIVQTFGWYTRLCGITISLVTLLNFALWRATLCVADLFVSWWSTRTKVQGNALTQNEYLMYYGIFVCISTVFLAVRQVPFVMAILRGSRRAHERLLAAVLSAPTSFFDTTPVGRIINRMSKDTEMVDLVVPETLNFCIGTIITVLGAFIVMCYSGPYLSIGLVFVIFMYSVLIRFFSRTNRAIKVLEAVNRSPMMALMNQTLGGLSTLRAYGMTTISMREHEKRVDLSARSTFAFRMASRWMGTRVDTLSAIIILITGIVTCALVVTNNGSFSSRANIVSLASLAITYAQAATLSLSFVTYLLSDFESAFSAFERVREYIETVPREQDVTYGTAPGDVPPPRATWPEEGRIAFEGVSLRYRDGLPLVLKDVTFTAHPAEKVGVVGRTGSGKSTIMLSLFRMVELAGGRIVIDGHDIAQLKMRDLRSKITIIPQDPLLFEGTVRSNLDPYATASDEEMWSVLGKTGLLPRIESTGLGLESEVADRGSNFSVGQRQLLCLARALLKRSRILLLDEATASVDFESDAMIQETIRREFSHCTVLTIAHRLATIIDSDRVVVLDQGVLVENGAPGKLLADPNSVFHAMVATLGDEQFEQLKRIADAKLLASQ